MPVRFVNYHSSIGCHDGTHPLHFLEKPSDTTTTIRRVLLKTISLFLGANFCPSPWGVSSDDLDFFSAVTLSPLGHLMSNLIEFRWSGCLSTASFGLAQTRVLILEALGVFVASPKFLVIPEFHYPLSPGTVSQRSRPTRRRSGIQGGGSLTVSKNR